MGRIYDGIDGRLRAFIEAQHVFFVATAPLAANGHVNLSPKGLDGSLAILDDHRIAYLDLTGSGVETIAHLQENGRIVVMFCAFEGPPRIVRLHGTGTVHHTGSAEYDALAPNFPERLSARAVIDIAVTRISDSCGYGVPLMRFEHDRDQLDHWAEAKGPDGLVTYRSEKNVRSVDALPGIPA